MAQDSWPSPAHNSREVTDPEYEEIAGLFPFGVRGGPNDSSVIYTSGGLQVLVRAGKRAMLRGHAWYSGAADDTLAITSNSSGQTRIDRVVLRLDRSTWTVRAVVKTGTPGAGPPVLTQQEGDTGVFEIQLALVTVPNGATGVTVAREELYIGTPSVRVATSTTGNLLPAPGEISYEVDTGRWVGNKSGARVTLFEDTGWAALTMNGPNGNAWTPSNCRIRKINNVCHLRVQAKRWSTSGLGLDDNDGSVPIILASAFRPTATEMGFGLHSRSPVGLRIEPDGSVRIFPLSTAIPAGITVTGSATWMVG